jgi:hypothetical protein
VIADRVSIGFDGLRVEVRSPVPEVLAEVERTFRAMIISRPEAPAGGRVVAELTVTRWGDGYRVAGSGIQAETGPLAEVRRAIRYHATRAFVEARPERLWLHAAAARRGTRAVILPGARARGKSTLVTALARDGWQYLSDEAVPVDMAGDRAAPFPLTPHVRVGPAEALPPDAVAALAKRDVPLAPGVVCREPVRITELVFVDYQPGARAALLPTSAGEASLDLVASCLNFPHHGARAVRYVAALTGRLPAARLVWSDVDAAVRVLGEAK